MRSCVHTAVIAELGRTEEIAPLYQAMPELIANVAVALTTGGVQTMAALRPRRPANGARP